MGDHYSAKRGADEIKRQSISGEDVNSVSLQLGTDRSGIVSGTRRRFMALVLIMIVACGVGMTIVTVMLYHHSIEEHKEQLLTTARSQARLIEAMARYDINIAINLRDEDPEYNAFAATLSQITEAHGSYDGFGETGEFTLARRDGNSIVFVLQHRHIVIEDHASVSFDSNLAEPMRRALKGKSGTVIGLDYRGELVLAAHEPVSVLNLGIVAKIDLAEIRAPFIKSGLTATAVALIFVLAGTVLFIHVGNPIMTRLEKYSRALEKEVQERKQVEEELRDSKERFMLLFENAPLGYQSLSAKGDFIELNETWCKVLGYTKEEVLGRNFSEFIHPDFREVFKENFPKFKSMGYILGVEFEMIKKDGSEIIVSFDGKIGYKDDGSFKQTHCVLSDITESKRAKDELLESKERLHTIFSSSADYLMLLDKKHRVRLINRVEPGMEMADFVGKSLSELAAPADQARIEILLDQVVKKAQKKQYDTVRDLSDGTRVYFNTIVAPIVISGKVTGTVVSTRDVTELRRLEEQYRQAQKMESIGRLAGGVSHDLNNLLSPIIGYSEILMSDMDHNNVRREYADEILKAGMRARDLVRQLLAFSRKQTLEYMPVDMNKVITGIDKLLRRAIREDVEIKIIPSLEICTIMADLGQLEQVIMNLAVNAADAMPEGGQLTIETGMAELDDDYAAEHQDVEPGSYVLLTVSDTGCGMDNDTRSHIFEPFFSTKGEQGTGLGLATVYGIVRQHGGCIMTVSEPGEGTTFNVYIPLSNAAVVEGKTDKKVVADLRGQETILLVEDDEHVRQLAFSILERYGYKVIAAKDGAEALKILDACNDPVQLLLTDVVMPVMNGKDLFNKASAKRKDLKVLYMSGYHDDVIAHRGVLEDGLAFIQKPFSVETLASKVRDVLIKQCNQIE